ncbi:porin [Spiribacter sp. 218]|uniref:porin n=1 Tax=Spiribacter pallidus TaxID=1987936 RepID=UPI00349F8A90
MKNVSKLALFVAAGMVSAGVNAAEVELNETTTLSLEGEVAIKYFEETRSNDSTDSDFADEDSKFVFKGERDLPNNMTVYTEAEAEYDTVEEGGDFTVVGIFGLEGDFGEVIVGEDDNVFESAITDITDPFENASLSGVSDTAEDRLIGFYSPEINGFEYQLQTRIGGDGVDATNGDNEGRELALMAALQYDFGMGAIHAAYDNRGATQDANDEYNQNAATGVGATFNIAETAELGLKYASEDNNAAEGVDLTAISLVVGYGGGDLYGAYQDVSPDDSDSRTEFAIGVNYNLADDFYIYAEHGSFDRNDGSTNSDNEFNTDELTEVGLVYEW